MILQSLFDRQFDRVSFSSLYRYRNELNLVKQLSLSNKLDVHSGCVNTICWSDSKQSLILSGSDDHNLCITNAFDGKNLCKIPTAHKTNIFSAKFVPSSNDEKLISASASGEIFVTNINRSLTENSLNKFACHGDKTCFELRTFQQDPFIFMSCGQDGTIKWFDLRQSNKCEHSSCNGHTLIHLSNGITAFASNPIYPFQLTCASLDGIVRLYDRRMLAATSGSLNENKKSPYGLFAYFSSQSVDSNCKRVTSIQYSNDGAEILASYQPEHVYLLDWRDLGTESTHNKPKETLEEVDLKTEQPAQEPKLGSTKFRIRTDWSDTGPNSIAFNEMSNNDPRSFLAKRINDWFATMIQGNNNQRATQQTRNRIENQTSTIDNDESQSEDDEDLNLTDSAKRERREQQTLNAPEDEQEIINMRNKSFITITNSLVGSRFRTKQAQRSENNLIKQTPVPKIKRVFSGHRNVRTIIKEANFWGNDYVVSGSDCGHVFVWNKHSSQVVNVLEADKHVVNCVQENPVYPVLATSGIDYDVKIWQPILSNELSDKEQNIESAIRRNRLMINENKNTIFIPVQFMMPALRLFGAEMRRVTRNSNEDGTENNTTDL